MRLDFLSIPLVPTVAKVETQRDVASVDFSARLRVFHDDGWLSLELLLINRSDITVWVEDVTVDLSDLEPNWQTANAAGQARHEIRQNVSPLDTLRVSLAGAIYDAAGRPQDPYSSIVRTVVHYAYSMNGLRQRSNHAASRWRRSL